MNDSRNNHEEPVQQILEEGAFLKHGQVGSVHVNFGDMVDLRNGLLAGLLVDAAHRGDLLDVSLSAFAAAVARVKKLSRHEVLVLDTVKSLTGGGNIHKVWIEEDKLVARLHESDPDLSVDAARRLVATMQSQRILEEGAGKLRVVW